MSQIWSRGQAKTGNPDYTDVDKTYLETAAKLRVLGKECPDCCVNRKPVARHHMTERKRTTQIWHGRKTNRDADVIL